MLKTGIVIEKSKFVGVLPLSKVNLLELTPQEIEGFFHSLGEPAYRKNQLLHWIWRRNVLEFDNMSNFSLQLRQKLRKHATMGSAEPVLRQQSRDGTIKFLLALSDQHTVETVILPYEIGESVCLSTQVGCRMGCAFCASGLPGLIRNLTSGEIALQLLVAKRLLQEENRKLKSMVLMGTGEPLDNFDATVTFLEAVSDQERLGMSLRHVTLSTCGLVPKILELAKTGWPLNLAVSLHASNNELRNRIMPINKKYPLEKLLVACDQYASLTGRRVTYEYILIDGLNDEPRFAKELAGLLKGRLCHVNLIPFNAVSELNFRPSPQEKVKLFKKILTDAGVNVTVRRRLGDDIAAACGQLRNKYRGERNKG